MVITPHDNNFVYDSSRGIYIARDFLKGERALRAAEKTGINVCLYGTNSYLDSPKDRKKLEELMRNLSQLQQFPKTQSRVPTIQEYEDLMKWAKENDPELFVSRGDQLEVLYDPKKSIHMVCSEYPLEEYHTLGDNIFPCPIGTAIREVIEKSNTKPNFNLTTWLQKFIQRN